MRRIRHPDCRQLPGPMQLCRHYRIATIRLHPITRRHRDQRGHHDNAIVAHLGELPVKTMAARPCFIARTQPTTPDGQLLHQFADVI